MKTLLFTHLHHLHQFIERIEAAGETGIGIELNEDFFGFVDRESGIKSLIQSRIQFPHLAACHRSGNQGDRLLAFRQGIRYVHIWSRPVRNYRLLLG